ncbi:hypothetical protein FNW02_11450 [Komarekiella sp. 'clone 1']|uniref:Uncharacterized protein n=1 Tax=Komarekiella delphini-convector SJRDD-AB1 TaxID=2593771 RepID=A0AA40SWP2_9NOST|nr:hypothetical protein [Komarekiella delphini-convector]MBD6616434.1 hypothetical protein [Komarekiella delphini-convector SJRDD-AB1]
MGDDLLEFSRLGQTEMRSTTVIISQLVQQAGTIAVAGGTGRAIASLADRAIGSGRGRPSATVVSAAKFIVECNQVHPRSPHSSTWRTHLGRRRDRPGRTTLYFSLSKHEAQL